MSNRLPKVAYMEGVSGTLPGLRLGPVDWALPGPTMRGLIVQWLIVQGFVVAGFLLPAPMVRADTLDEIGYTQLQGLLGSSTPNGAGVPISMVEAPNGSGGYMPDATSAEFTAGTDPFSESVNFINRSNTSSNVSAHATSTVGHNFIGNTLSMASGANKVDVYEAGKWMATVLRSTNNLEPKPLPGDDYLVQNFSWISTTNNGSTEAENRDVLQRFDYLIDTYYLTAVVGLNNNTNPLPQLLSHSYNAIAVGRTDGKHSRGPTQSFYGPGRIKPDLVAPKGSTSEATAVVSSAATMLHEAVVGTDGANSEVMKALLLAGATKGEFSNWSRTTTQPLDDVFGAGELNVYNSYLMTAGGQTIGSTDDTGGLVNTAPTHGWDYRTVQPTIAPQGGQSVVNQDLFYNLVVPEGSVAAELSVLLAWNAEVTDGNEGLIFDGIVSLANLDLALYDSSTTFLGDLIDESISTVDNIEHIYQTDLGPGTYTLKVSTDSARDFGLAWRLNTLFDEPSADFDGDSDIDGSDFLAWQRGYGTLIGATRADGDSDGDGDVDRDDLALLQESFGSASLSQNFEFAPLIATVPEPSTLLQLVLLFAWALWIPRRNGTLFGAMVS